MLVRRLFVFICLSLTTFSAWSTGASIENAGRFAFGSLSIQNNLFSGIPAVTCGELPSCFINQGLEKADNWAIARFDESDDFQQDRNICECLAGQGQVSQAPVNAEEYNSSLLRENIRRASSASQSFRNSLILNASVLSSNTETTASLVEQFVNTSDVANQMISQATASVSEVTPQHQNLQSLLAAPRVDPSLIDTELTLQNCVSIRDFWNFQMAPSDNEFYLDVLSSNESTFNENAWDYGKIRDEFHNLSIAPENRNLTLTALLAKPALKRLYLRMDFLQKNPIIRTFFAAHDAGNGINLLEKKRELHGIIINSFAPLRTSCTAQARSGSCRRDASASNGPLMTMKNNVTNFVTAPGIVDTIQREAGLEMSYLIGEVRNKLSETPVPNRAALQRMASTDPTLQEKLMDRSCVPRARPLAEGSSEPLVFQSDVTTLQCNAAYAPYCRILAQANLPQRNPLEILEEGWVSDLNPNPEENERFKSYRRRTCSDRKRHSSGNPELTFSEYHAQQCTTNPIAACSSIALLRNKFLELYIGLDTSPDAKLDDQFIRSAFRNRDVAQLSQNQIFELRTTIKKENSRIDTGRYVNPKPVNAQRVNKSQVSNDIASDSVNHDDQLVPVSSTPSSQSVPSFSPGLTSPTETIAASNVSRELEAARVQAQELERSRSQIAEDIESAQSQLGNSVGSSEQAALQARIDSMTQLMNSKDQEMASNRQMMDRLLGQMERSQNSGSSNNQPERTSVQPETNRSPAGADPFISESTNESAYSGGSFQSGESQGAKRSQSAPLSSFGSGSQAMSPGSSSSNSLNTALLETKYGLSLNAQARARGDIIVVSGQDANALNTLDAENGRSGQVISVAVSPEIFERFKNEDPEILREYAVRIGLNSSAKFEVTTRNTNGEIENLVVYGMRQEHGIVFVQRNVRLSSLENLVAPQN